MKALLAVALMATLALAGCASKNDTASSTTTTTSTTTAHTNTTAPKPDQPPMIHSFSATRANATSLRFTFRFDAMDPDGDNLTWTLDPIGKGVVAANGTHFPGNVTLTYAAAGRFNATLRVSDGRATVNQTLPINATAAAGILATATFTWTAGSAGCTVYPALLVTNAPYQPGTPAGGVLYGEIAVPAAWAGHAFTANFGAPGSPQDGVILTYYGPAGTTGSSVTGSFTNGSGATMVPPGPAPSNPMIVTGKVPVGSAWAMGVNCASASGATVAMTILG